MTPGRVGTEKYRIKPLRWVRGLRFRGECVGRSTATHVIAAQTRRYVARQRDPSLSRAAIKDPLEPIPSGQLWIGEWFRKTGGSLIVICRHRNGFFESVAKLGFGWPSSFPIVVWKRKGKAHGIQA